MCIYRKFQTFNLSVMSGFICLDVAGLVRLKASPEHLLLHLDQIFLIP